MYFIFWIPFPLQTYFLNANESYEGVLYLPAPPPTQALLNPLTKFSRIWSQAEGSEILNLWKCCTNKQWRKTWLRKNQGEFGYYALLLMCRLLAAIEEGLAAANAANQNKTKSHWKCKGISEQVVMLSLCWESGCPCIKELSLYPPCHKNLALFCWPEI